MDVVEAIDTWIDARIDDLSDDELELILELLDVISDSEFADLDVNEIYNEDIDDMVALFGGHADDRDYARRVLRSSLYGENYSDADGPTPVDADQDDEFTDDDTLDEPIWADQDDEFTDDDTLDEPIWADQDDEFTDDDTLDEPIWADQDDEFTDDDTLDEPIDDTDEFTDETLDDEEAAEATPDDEVAEDEPAAPGDIAFYADLAKTALLPITGPNTADDTTTLPVTEPSADDDDESVGPDPALFDASPVELLPGDELGPSFLTLAPTPPRSRQQRWRRYAVTALWAVGLAAFVVGSLQLIGSLSEDQAPVAAETVAAEPTEAPADPTAAPTEPPAEDEPDSEADAADSQVATEPTAVPEPPRPTRIGIRLVTGDVMLASVDAQTGAVSVRKIYDAADDDLAPATHIAWLGELIGVVDGDGDVLVVEPDASRPIPKRLYEAGGGLAEAVEVVPVLGRIAVRTGDGDISIIPADERTDPDIIEFLWDADEEGVAAVDISSVDTLLAFVLEDGNGKVIADGEDGEDIVADIWSAEDQPPAFNLDASPTGILLGVGQGAVARFELGEVSGPPVISVWNPFDTGETPAIGYAASGKLTAVVLADGGIVLADETGSGEKIWDPETTELRGLAVSATDSEVIVLLETGSVVRIPRNRDEPIESIWDITDATLSPANQVTLEPPLTD